MSVIQFPSDDLTSDELAAIYTALTLDNFSREAQEVAARLKGAGDSGERTKLLEDAVRLADGAAERVWSHTKDNI